jgi:hypothetical protein
MDSQPTTGKNLALSKGARIVLRTVGTINGVAALLGTYFQVGSSYFFLTKYADPSAPPSFRPILATMTLINLAFVGVLLVTSVRFIQAKASGASLYSLTVLMVLFYGMGTRELWRVGGGIGISVAGATGVGNLGIAPFLFVFLVPYLYPFVSMVLVQGIKYRQSAAHALTSTTSLGLR